LTAVEWLEIAAGQGWHCPICLRSDVELVTDHLHLAGFKRLPPEERKRYVRGLPCRHCNLRVIPERATAETAQRVADYLRAHEMRFAGPPANHNKR
jgi:serine kinase of HPr protein (carbohydrate metabolism regulator)